ncbi:germinal-center associated nuclear -like isoform X1 [Brachionus plicatilis]|uniref:Germinal-center associated nuclear-like isoform X1 n=1 Tax=Brachionus plicatilis TaxID=10195 RepID=A0A3M7RBY5_BRAPC|nr:germinal-center associated nuclear -like isoform X1 [Brachionus plicatilis]
MDAQQFSILQASEESIKKFDLQVTDKREFLQLINDTFKKPSITSKEKFDTLVLRDKILKLIRHELYQISPVSSGKIIQGTCQDMCPEKERFSREHLGLCHKYEFSADNQQPDHYIMVKEYSRSSADQDLPLPNEMRSLDVLYDTMLYIIDKIITRIEESSTESGFFYNAEIFSIVEWYDFVWNRTRSIRKEIIQQRLLTSDSEPDLKGVFIIEQCARFHIMCSHRLCDQASDIFDFKINEENLKNCFQSLRQYYQTSHELGSNLPASPFEAEFRSYIILLNLTESNILGEIQRWPKEIRHSRSVHFALNCYFAFNSKNYVKFFRLIASDECEYLQSCILHRHFFSARLDAFKTIFNSFKENKEKNYPIDKLVEILEKFSKIASEAPIASEATQSAVKKVLSKHKNPIACPECGKLMKNERGVKQHIAKIHK